MKLYMPIYSSSDTISLQDNLDLFSSWCTSNGMVLNIFKCVCISFIRFKSSINCQYFINGTALNSVNQVRNLGIILSADLSFNAHINFTYGKSLRVLGFIKRTCSNFNDPICMKILYCSLVRSLFEYGTVLWNTNQSGLVKKLEKYKKMFTFLRF
uniref:RNA-directed DNA polymerase n=1 Tax=Sipha flava TaxID=143950 RepID=A0A2S2QQ72_9HEMI